MFDEKNAEENLESGGDRRSYDRSRFIVDVLFDGGDATGVASTRDIGIGGLYMNTKTVLPEGALLKLRLPLGKEAPLVVDAEVVYSQAGSGVGVRFHNLSTEDRDRLERTLAAEKADY